ncbi:MAG: hypothetical protein LBG15_10100 [Dysgonamonadaceae bacterium]|jgi:hypothetical protein|nr:hypothetical protein [Dysgonamonadaceae bacterium]
MGFNIPNCPLTADEIDKNRQLLIDDLRNIDYEQFWDEILIWQLSTAEIIFAQSEKPLKNNASIFAPKITSVKYGTANIDKRRLSETDKHRD